jgi:hypothetical protein
LIPMACDCLGLKAMHERATRQGFLATGEDVEAVAVVRKTFDDREEAVSHPVPFRRMCLSRRMLRDEQSQCR